MVKEKPQNVEAYVEQFPAEVQERLRDLLACLIEVVPEADLSLKWGTPAFTYGRVLFTVAAFTRHVNFYPTPAALRAFGQALTAYKTTKSALQLPYAEELPIQLIQEIAKYRLQDVVENDAKWM